MATKLRSFYCQNSLFTGMNPEANFEVHHRHCSGQLNVPPSFASGKFDLQVSVYFVSEIWVSLERNRRYLCIVLIC